MNFVPISYAKAMSRAAAPRVFPREYDGSPGEAAPSISSLKF